MSRTVGSGKPIRGVVVAHGDLAHALVRAVERISGVHDALLAVSNEGASPDELRRRVEDAAGGERTILFVDLSSGSCAFTGRVVARAAPGVAVVTGANLPMLLDFVFHRDMSVEALVDRVVEKGRGSVASPRAETTR